MAADSGATEVAGVKLEETGTRKTFYGTCFGSGNEQVKTNVRGPAKFSAREDAEMNSSGRKKAKEFYLASTEAQRSESYTHSKSGTGDGKIIQGDTRGLSLERRGQ